MKPKLTMSHTKFCHQYIMSSACSKKTFFKNYFHLTLRGNWTNRRLYSLWLKIHYNFFSQFYLPLPIWRQPEFSKYGVWDYFARPDIGSKAYCKKMLNGPWAYIAWAFRNVTWVFIMFSRAWTALGLSGGYESGRSTSYHINPQ